MIFIGIFRTWNLVSRLVHYQKCIPDRIRFQYTEDRISAGGSSFFRYGILNNKKVYLDSEDTYDDTILDVWRTDDRFGYYKAHSRKSSESKSEFKFRITFKYFKSTSIWLGIFFILHFITLTIKRYVHIEELPPRPKQNFYDY